MFTKAIGAPKRSARERVACPAGGACNTSLTPIVPPGPVHDDELLSEVLLDELG